MSFHIFAEVGRYSFWQGLPYLIVCLPILLWGVWHSCQRHKQFLRGERPGVRKSSGLFDYLFFWMRD